MDCALHTSTVTLGAFVLNSWALCWGLGAGLGDGVGGAEHRLEDWTGRMGDSPGARTAEQRLLEVMDTVFEQIGAGQGSEQVT